MNKSINRREFLSVLGYGVAEIQALSVLSYSYHDSIPVSNDNNKFQAINSKNLIIYPVPQEEELSTDYAVEINRHPVGILTARVNDPPKNMLDYGGKYSFINFDFKGEVHIRIFSKRTLEMLQIRPLSRKLQKRIIDENTVELILEKPCFLSFEPEGKRHPLLIFANPMEVDPPGKNDPDVIYFGAGVHKPEGGIINMKSNQILYLAGGSVVQAAIRITDSENVTIRGRGILDGSTWNHLKGPSQWFVSIMNSRNINIEGIILRGACCYNLCPEGCENLTVENIKICGGRVANDDGIDPVNTRHMKVKNCFIRTDDDCLAVKGHNLEWGDVDDIIFEDMVLWNDRSMIARFGVESRAANMQNMILRNLDIIHYGRQAFVFEPEEEMNLQNILLEDIRIEGDGQRLLIAVMPVIHPYRPAIRGHIRNIHFRKVQLTGAWGDYGYGDTLHPYSIEVGYFDDKHRCEDIAFEDFTILGYKLSRESPRLVIKNDGSVIVK
jgi:hypothetical protein